ncbi:MAG TPA: TonB-dependent receptor [Flavisolibacter sp.]|nr:TonB-dependent receptor [Flavisolibacter sp.]
MRKLLYAIVLPVMLMFSLKSIAQNKTVTGRVLDTAGRGIPGVSVSVKGQSALGTTTADGGTYSLSVPSGTTTLVFSSVGYSAQELTITGRSSVDVTLQPTAGNLSEVVVIGYGTARKRDLTGSVTAITAKDFQKGAIVSPEQLIAGKVAGVQITTNGGAPGAGSTIRIRGGSSLNASNDPLIVIDGVPIANGGISGSANALSLINPNDIESFNVLKDASAAAIYGSRASNGVIIITTKKGRNGKARFNFSTQNSISTLPKKADVLTADEIRTYVRANGTAAQAGILGNANTDWQEEVFDQAFMTDNNLSVTGGIKNVVPYRVSLGYLNQDGILRTGNLQRTSLAININPTLFKDLRVDLNLKGSYSKSRFADEGAIGNAVRFDPTQPVFSGGKRFGGYTEWLDAASITGLRSLAPRNPVGLLEQRNDRSNVKRSLGNLQLDYRLPFFKDLRANLNVGYDIAEGKGNIDIVDSAASVYKRYLRPSDNTYHSGVMNQYRQTRRNTTLDAYLNYTKEVSSIRSRFDVTAGYSFQNFLTTNYAFPDRTNDGVVVSPITFPFDKPENTIISYFSRLNYTFNGKYLLTATVRRDGSSRFSKENRWGTFPSGAFAWRIKDEDFLKSSRTFSDLKLRIGYGVTGQQEGIGLYDYLPRYSVSDSEARYQFGDAFYSLYRPSGYNPNLKWEQTATYNAGLDFGFASNRITGTLDFYIKKTKDLLSEVDQPAGTNFSNKIISNIGQMENRGVELAINTQVVKGRDLNIDLNFNATYNQNEITRLTFTNDPNFPGNLTGGIAGGVGSSIQIQSVGFSRNSFYVYQQIYDKQGKPIEALFEDRNRDGIINSNDLYRFKSPDPQWFLGASSNISYNKFDASFTLRANLGNYVYNNRFSNTGVRRNIIDPLGFLANGSRNILETNFTGNGDAYFFSDYFIENASFLRMDNISVGFNAGDFLRKGTGLRFGATVQNVFVITDYRGLDPEVAGGIDNNFYPRPRNFVLSANLSF